MPARHECNGASRESNRASRPCDPRAQRIITRSWPERDGRSHAAGSHLKAVGIWLSVEGADVAPVAPVPVGLARALVVGEVVDLGLAPADQQGDDVAAQVVLGALVAGVDRD